jgi:hexosaminidase
LSNALDKGFDVVLSPRRPLYFDFVQDDSHQIGRRWDGFNDLQQVYEYPDFPANYPEKQQEQILGMQASMWSETVQTRERLDYMIFPRLTAIAEAAWTDASNKDYEDYLLRLESMLERFDVLNINYFNPFTPEETPEPQE